VDKNANVYIANYFGSYIVELPRISSGYGKPILLATGLNFPSAVGVDPSGDVFILNTGNFNAPPPSVVELPRTSSGFGAPQTIPTSGLFVPSGLAVDSSANVYVADISNLITEFPKTEERYGQPIILPFNSLDSPSGVAVDNLGNVFAADTFDLRAVELPRLATHYGPQTTLPVNGLSNTYGVAVDQAGGVFMTTPNQVIRVQTQSVNFGGAYACASGRTTTAPCNQTLPFRFKVNADQTLGAPRVLTDGAPDLDFTLGAGNTCTGTVTAGTLCKLKVVFAPRGSGTRTGSVEIPDSNGNVLATVAISGLGLTP
jgi:hypothetical protein